ncbi:MAG: hypothetical protein HY741_00945 [Chloroflexi bacterium]|nr:hypothetical protein [Chloroflexota bacterium]
MSSPIPVGQPQGIAPTIPQTNQEFALGVKVLVAKGDLETLCSCLARELPPIAFVNTGQLSYWNEATGHAVVIVGIENNQVLVNDPAFPEAPQEISIDEFMLAWMDMDQFYGLIEKED